MLRGNRLLESERRVRCDCESLSVSQRATPGRSTVSCFVSSQHPVQRDAVQSQTARGEREVATRFLNYAFDEQTLLLGYRPPDFAFSLPQFLEVGGRSLKYFFQRVLLEADAFGAQLQNLRGQIAHAYDIFGSKSDQAMNQVLKLAHVSTKRVFFQQLNCLTLHADLLAIYRTEFI